MPTYTYSGPDRMFMDLRVGPDVQVTPAAGAPPPSGSTVELHAGDILTTVEAIEHPDLTESAGASATSTAPAGRRPAPAASASTAPSEE